MGESPLRELEEFFAKFKPYRLRKGEVILRAQETPPGVFYLKKGFVRLYAISAGGEELTLIIFKPEDFFPIMWAINKTSNNYFLEAMTFCELWCCPREKFVNFLRVNPRVQLELFSRILTRLGGILKRTEYLVFGHALAKVAAILVICAQRFGEREGGKVVIGVPLRHIDIGNLAGLARETTSVEMKKLERKGLIGYRGRFLVVKDLRGLRRQSLLG